MDESTESIAAHTVAVGAVEVGAADVAVEAPETPAAAVSAMAVPRGALGARPLRHIARALCGGVGAGVGSVPTPPLGTRPRRGRRQRRGLRGIQRESRAVTCNKVHVLMNA